MKRILALLISVELFLTLGAAFADEKAAPMTDEQKVPAQQQNKDAWKKQTREIAKANRKNAMDRMKYRKTHPIFIPKQKTPAPAGK